MPSIIMKRSTDEIRYLLLKELNKVQMGNLESLREKIGTGLTSVLLNAEAMEKMGFIKIHATNIGKRTYRELKITNDGKKYYERLRKLIED